MPRSPEPSRELDEVGRKLYFRVKGWIADFADWSESDQLLVNQACMYEKRAREARAAFQRGDGITAGGAYTVIGSSGSPVVSPMIRVAETAEKQFIECLKELGLTPKARAQLKIEVKPDTGDDPLAQAFK